MILRKASITGSGVIATHICHPSLPSVIAIRHCHSYLMKYSPSLPIRGATDNRVREVARVCVVQLKRGATDNRVREVARVCVVQLKPDTGMLEDSHVRGTGCRS